MYKLKLVESILNLSYYINDQKTLNVLKITFTHTMKKWRSI